MDNVSDDSVLERQPKMQQAASKDKGAELKESKFTWQQYLPEFQYSQTLIHPISDDILMKNRLLCQKQPEKVKQAYKQLRTQVIQKMVANNWNSLAVLGMREKQGATSTAVNLAISLSLDPRVSVLLVDLNLRSPGVHRCFDYSPTTGLQDYFLDLVEFPQLLLNPGIDRLVALTNEDKMEHSSEFLVSAKISKLIHEIRYRYANRIIIFDFPPLLEADDVLVCMNYFDAGLLVINEGYTHKNDLSLAAQLMGDKPIIGSVLTNAI